MEDRGHVPLRMPNKPHIGPKAGVDRGGTEVAGVEDTCAPEPSGGAWTLRILVGGAIAIDTIGLYGESRS